MLNIVIQFFSSHLVFHLSTSAGGWRYAPHIYLVYNKSIIHLPLGAHKLVGFQHSIAMKTSPIFLLLSSLRVGVVIASDTQQHNDTDTSAEASINGIGDVELEDLRTSKVIDKIEE